MSLHRPQSPRARESVWEPSKQLPTGAGKYFYAEMDLRNVSSGTRIFYTFSIDGAARSPCSHLCTGHMKDKTSFIAYGDIGLRGHTTTLLKKSGPS